MPSAGVGCNDDISVSVSGGKEFQCPRRAWVATRAGCCARGESAGFQCPRRAWVATCRRFAERLDVSFNALGGRGLQHCPLTRTPLRKVSMPSAGVGCNATMRLQVAVS